jgi:ribosomal protein L11 methyltransferase
MDQFQPMRFGERTWIVPSNQQLPPEADATRAVVVKLDPGLAFGSGTHPTTALCLAWLDGLDLSGKTVLDFGCGSGILALAALKLGAARAVGVDNDPQALTASVDNAQRNGVARKLAVYMPDDEPIEKYPVVVANILAVALDALAALLASRVETGGVIALSGILDGQDTELLLRYSAWFDELAVAKQGDWVRITGRRKASP